MARFSLFALLAATMAATASGFAPTFSQPRAPTALGVAIDTSDIKNGMTIELDGEPWKVRRFWNGPPYERFSSGLIDSKNILSFDIGT